MEVRFCPGCGARVPEGNQFCMGCGRKLPSVAKAEPGKPEQRVEIPAKNSGPSQQVETPSPKARRTGANAFGIAFGIVFVACLMVYFFWTPHSNSGSYSNTKTAVTPTTAVTTTTVVTPITYDIPPAQIFYSSTSGADYSNRAQKIASAIDYTNSITRNYAVQLAAKYPGNYSISQICQIWEDVKPNWKYVNDPAGSDYFAPASQSIGNGLAGDCDDFAIVMAALIQAIGGGTRVVSGFAEPSGHAWAEVYVGNQQDSKCQSVLQSVARRYHTAEIYTHADADGGLWMNLDWSASHPGGPFYNASSYLLVRSSGYWQFGYFK